jgi:hypothetical protein
MMVFDRKGQENFNNHALRNPASSANDKLGTLGENVDLNWDVAKYQHLGISESLNFREPIQNQFKLMYDLTGDEQYNKRFLSHQIVGAKKKAGEASLKDFDLNKRFFESQHDAIIKLQEQYPDAGLVTWSQMSEKRNAELKQMNFDLQKLQDRSQTFDVSVGNVASMGAYFMDPELLATLPFSGGASVGGRIAANAWRSFKIESGLAFVSESVIAPKVYDFQHQIGNEEYGLKDAAIRIMTATLAAGVIRAGGSVTIDLSKIGIAKAKLIKQGKPNEAHVLDYYAKLTEDAKTVEGFIHDASIAANPKEYARPVAAIEADIVNIKKSIENAKAVLSKKGIDTDNSIIIKGRKKDLAEKELQLEVLIKEQQQYLLSKTNEATTYANQFVSAHIAAQSKVAQAFESGKFISQKEIDDALGVDASQGMALAKRLIGDDAQEIGLDEFIAKPRSEAVTLEELAREFKTVKAFIKGLDNRDFSSFKKGELDKHGYVKTVLARNFIDEQRNLHKEFPKEFRKAIDELGVVWSKKDKSWVRPPKDIDAYYKGKEKLKKVSKEELKSVWKEGQKSIKAIKEARTKVIKNLPRLIDDKETLATITGLANTKGPVSDAIDDAARRIKGGESVQQATRDILPELRRSTEPGADARAVDDGAGDGQPALKPETEPKIGRPVRLSELDSATRVKVVADFKNKLKKQNLTAKQYYKKAQAPQKKIEKIGRELEKTLGDKVAFLTPGVKLLEKVKNKIDERKYTGAWELTDVCRCGFAVKDSKDIEAIITRLSKDLEVLDEGINFRESGYFDHVLSVRFKNGVVGEIQLWEPHVLAVKEGSEFVEKIFPKHLKEYVSGIKVPPKEKSGHSLYEKQKDVAKDSKIWLKLEEEMKELYAWVSRSANTSWKASLERSLPDAEIKAGSASVHDPALSPERTTQPDTDSSGGNATTAGRPSQSKNLDTSLKSNDVINQTSSNIIPKDKDLITLNEIKVQEAQKLIDALGDDLQMVSGVKDSGKGDSVLEFKTARETFKEIDNEQKLVDDLLKCVGS